MNASTNGGQRPIEAAARQLLPATVTTFLDVGAEPASALTTVLVWWVANVRWAKYRAGEVVAVIEALRAGGAVVGDRDRELAAEGGLPTVVSALDA